MATLVNKFLSSGHSSYLSQFPVAVNATEDKEDWIEGSWRFLSLLLAQIQAYKNQFGHSFAFDASTIWNELPGDVSPASSVSPFRKKLKPF